MDVQSGQKTDAKEEILSRYLALKTLAKIRSTMVRLTLTFLRMSVFLKYLKIQMILTQ
jgi:hypothetical protein